MLAYANIINKLKYFIGRCHNLLYRSPVTNSKYYDF